MFHVFIKNYSKKCGASGLFEYNTIHCYFNIVNIIYLIFSGENHDIRFCNIQ